MLSTPDYVKEKNAKRLKITHTVKSLSCTPPGSHMQYSTSVKISLHLHLWLAWEMNLFFVLSKVNVAASKIGTGGMWFMLECAVFIITYVPLCQQHHLWLLSPVAVFLFAIFTTPIVTIFALHLVNLLDKHNNSPHCWFSAGYWETCKMKCLPKSKQFNQN